MMNKSKIQQTVELIYYDIEMIHNLAATSHHLYCKVFWLSNKYIDRDINLFVT